MKRASVLLSLALMCAAALPSSVFGREPMFSPQTFTMLNIVPFSPGREDVSAQDMVEYEARTGNAIALYSLTLHPEGLPASEKVDFAVASYRRFAKALEGTRVRPGILLQAIIGHWTDDAVAHKSEPWQRSIDIDGRPVRFWRMPSSSRAYPLPLEKKAAAYRKLFTPIPQ